MQVKLSEVYNCIEPLNKLSELQLPLTVSYKLVKIVKKISDEIESIEKMRQKLIKKHGKEDESGNITVSEEKKTEFVNEFTTLLNTKIKLDFEPISLQEIKDLTMSVSDMGRLQFLFKE
jgi:hypothetical protein